MRPKKNTVIRVQASSVVITPGYQSDEVFASITIADSIDCLQELMGGEHQEDLLDYIRMNFLDEDDRVKELKEQINNERQRADEAVDRYENLLSEYSGA